MKMKVLRDAKCQIESVPDTYIKMAHELFIESDSLGKNNGSQHSNLTFIYIGLKSTLSEIIINYMI